MTTDIEDFVLQMARACLNIPSDIVIISHTILENEVASKKGEITFTFSTDDRQSWREHAVYTARRNGSEWLVGTYETVFPDGTTGPDTSYYCWYVEGSLDARLLADHRRHTELGRAVASFLNGLGHNAASIEKRIMQMGYAPTLEGVEGLVGRIFALEAKIHTEQREVILTRASDDMEITLITRDLKEFQKFLLKLPIVA